MLNLYKTEVSSSGKLINNVFNKVIGLLVFYQVAAAIAISARGHYLVVGVLVVIIIFTFTTYLLSKRYKLLRVELFVEQEFDLESNHLERWRKTYRHPVKDIYDINAGEVKEKLFNAHSFQLKSKIMYIDEDLKNLNTATKGNNRFHLSNY